MRMVEFGGVTPNLMYENANEVLDWLRRVCRFKGRARYVDQDSVVQQAEVNVGSSEVWLSGHGEGYWDTACDRTRTVFVSSK